MFVIGFFILLEIEDDFKKMVIVTNYGTRVFWLFNQSTNGPVNGILTTGEEGGDTLIQSLKVEIGQTSRKKTGNYPLVKDYKLAFMWTR